MANERDEQEAISILRHETDRRADFDLADAVRFLLASPGGEEAAFRFTDAYDAVIVAESADVAAQIAETGRPFERIDPAASAYFSRPTFRIELRTAKKRARRSGSGLWYVYYALRDSDADGKVDTLKVYAVSHSSSQPFAINTGQFDLPEDTEEDAHE